MAGKWHVRTLEKAPLEIIDGDRGTNYPNHVEFSATGHCLFLNAGNVTTTGFRFSDCAFITAAKDASLRKGKLVRSDVVVTTRGTVGNAAYFDDSVPFDHIRINSGMVILRAQTPALQPRYLYLFVRSALFHAQVSALRTGSAQPQLPIRDINRIEIPIPPPDEQLAIAHIVGTLDDKIELNRRMNETLEATTRALFKSWFVGFDPVRAKAEGRDPWLPKHVAVLFPDRFVDSDLGEIPEGWKVGPILPEQAFLLSGGTPKTDHREYWDGGVPWASAKDISQCNEPFLVVTERTITHKGLEESATQMIPPLSTVIVARGATTGRMAMVGSEMAMNQTCYAVVSKMETPFALYCHLKQTINQLVHAGHGSVFNTITTSTFNNSSLVLPPRNVLSQFERYVSPLFSRSHTAILESRTLAALRDTLLPKLISGELRIPVAEKLVDGAI